MTDRLAEIERIWADDNHTSDIWWLIAELKRLRAKNEGIEGVEAATAANWRLAHVENERLRGALRRIQQWDCLNPPDSCVADGPWLKKLVDEALA